MILDKRYTQWKNVPTNIQEAYKENRWSVSIPNTKAFRITRIDWTNVDWVNYIIMKGRFWTKTGKNIKL